jgi:LemA protein
MLYVVLALSVPLLWGVFSYNRFVRDRNRVLAGWSDIDVQLKRRHDLIPKLVDAVRRYGAYESALLEHVTELRARSRETRDVNELSALETELGAGLGKILAVAEAYPDLKANRSFLDLQKSLSTVEDAIQFARRYYNGAVRMLNTRCDSFPDLIVARVFRFHHADYFELDDHSQRLSPKV